MFDFIEKYLEMLSGAVSLASPAGLVAILVLALLADVGIAIPLIIEPALFLITYQYGPFSLPVLNFVVSLTLGRQIGTAFLYWLSRLAGYELGNWIRCCAPRFALGFINEAGRRLELLKARINKKPNFAYSPSRIQKKPFILEPRILLSRKMKIEPAGLLPELV